MHLVIVSPFPPVITGIGQYCYHITRELAKSHYFSRITVIAGAKPGAQSPNHLGKTKIEYLWKPGQFNAHRIIISRLKQLQPDLVWFNLGASIFGRSPWANLSGLSLPLFVRRMGFPTVVTLHELVELTDLRALNAPGGLFAFIGARLLTSLTTQADIVCLTMQSHADWLTPRQVECAHIPIGAYHEPEFLKESDSPHILFFTTLAPYKGLEILLKAYPQLRIKFPDLLLTIAGAEHARFPNYVGDLKKRFNGTEGILWLGEVDEENVIELFREAQVIILPYTASTGSSSVLYQAATWGRPVVASNIKEIRTLAGEIGLQIKYFDAGNVEELHKAISALLDSSSLRRSQAEHNLVCMQRLRPKEIARRYLHAFNHALKKRNSPKLIRDLK